MSIRQGIISKKRAKNKKAKYTYATTRTISQTNKRGTIIKKFSYTKKILLANGKYRYYYS